MLITIDLAPTEVAAFKSYIKETSGEINPKTTKVEITQEVQGIISSALQSGSLGDHYQMAITEAVESQLKNS